ncbi:maleylpyruvate isomerase family mycothiol-dependent enzyme [Specibacter sp. NPDC078709]|uniref:maleylpyruvate isomerase family mycothiol-dependent enzyme n=1 Tax=Specibacter sp. NPDC078709 TaxID=3154364 RepID=UPI00342F48E0
MAKIQDSGLWAFAHAERAALAEDLAALTPAQWKHESLCGQWDIEHVLAHLTAAASVGQWRWMRSMIGARFRPAVHNQRRLAEHLGATSGETLERFRAVINSSVAPSSHTPAYLGEVLVHAEDIRHPLGLSHTPPMAALMPVAEFYALRDFAVPSHRNAAGLQLKADDGPYTAGTGPLLEGPTLSLVMVLAGRSAHLDKLKGPGVEILRSRL